MYVCKYVGFRVQGSDGIRFHILLFPTKYALGFSRFQR